METIHIKGTEDTPTILLDKKNGLFEISGKSLPEDATQFYRPIIEWIRTYSKQANPTTEFIFKLEYFNTVTSKLFLDVLYELQNINGIKVVWYFHDDDEDMEETGQDFSQLVKIPFEFKTY